VFYAAHDQYAPGAAVSRQPASKEYKRRDPFQGLMRHGVDVISPSSWEPQDEGMMSIAANFASERNQGLSVQEKAKLQKVMLASLVTLQQGRR
jgi:hypothetical protein